MPVLLRLTVYGAVLLAWSLDVLGDQDARPAVHQVFFTLTADPDSKTVKCSFVEAQDVNPAKQESHVIRFEPPIKFSENCCAALKSRWGYSWLSLRGAEKDYCWWSERTPEEAIILTSPVS